MTDQPDFEAACLALLGWREHGIRLSDHVVMTLVCEDKGKQMARVLRVNGVEILVYQPPIWVNPNEHLAPWKAPESEPQTWEGQGLRIRRRGSEQLLDPHANSELIEIVFASKCGCTARATLGWIRKQLATGQRRVVVPGNRV